MKKQTLKVALMFGLLFSLSVAAVHAQTAQPRVVVVIPFEFVAGHQTLPAGEYVIKRIARNSDKALLVQSADGRASEVLMTNAVEADAKQQPEQARVEFRRYGDKYFLFQVWSGANTGRALPRSQQERALQRELQQQTSNLDIARLVSQPQTVTVKARAK